MSGLEILDRGEEADGLARGLESSGGRGDGETRESGAGGLLTGSRHGNCEDV